jgi:glycine dehydrogenase subunit 1
MDYVQITEPQRMEMLKSVGAGAIEDLFRQIPESIRLRRPLKLPPALDELSLRAHLSELAGADQSADNQVCFLGAGAYDHFIPAAVDFLAMKGEFLTAYTPYQAEASQGSLQAFFEFQTMVCQLTGLDVANASLYEGATALAEGALMALHHSGKREVFVSRGVHPHYRQVLKTYLSDLPVTLHEVGLAGGVTDLAALERAINPDTAAVIVQSPNFLGHIERVDTIAEAAHQAGSACVQAFNPLSVGLLKRPGELGADVAVADGQPLGIPLQFGGPYLGLFAARAAYMRKMPGRLVGQTVDTEGRRAFCLTLQTREQHIRREKATSNVCTNQGLLALRASVYLALMGPAGLRQAARLCHDKAAYLSDRLAAAGISRKFPDQPFFNEILVRLKSPVETAQKRAAAAGILAGYSIGNDYPELADCLLIAVTEKRTRGQIDRLVEVLAS